MCNHYDTEDPDYEEQIKFFEWTKKAARAQALTKQIWNPVRSAWPRSEMPIVIESEVREIVAMRWGVWPFYSAAKPTYVTNARDDGLLTKSIWKKSAAMRRCLIPATGFYEWTGPKGAKWEVRFAFPARPYFFFAGLWDNDPDGVGRGFAMVTTRPNEMLAEMHDRMPVILDDAGADAWIGSQPLPDDRLLGLCAPCAASEMQRTDQPPPKKITKAGLASDLFGG